MTQTAGVKERPILFSSPMVRAILEGRKTQTRRVMNPQPYLDTCRDDGKEYWLIDYEDPKKRAAWLKDSEPFWTHCAYGNPSDRLLCYNCFHGQPNNTQANSNISERRLHGGVGRANLQSDAVCGIRAQGASGLVSAKGQDAEGERLRDGDALPREQARYKGGSPLGLHSLSRDAAPGQAGDAAQGRRQDQQQTVESAMGYRSRELAGQAYPRNGDGGRETLGREVLKRRAQTYSVGDSEGALQPKAGGACAECRSIVDRRYRSEGTRLWVRESFYAYGKYRYTGKLTASGKPEVEFWDCTADANGEYLYTANETLPKPENRYEFGWHKRPSIFMPRWASRITLEITEVRVERLQDINGPDCLAEGVTLRPNGEDFLCTDFKAGWDKLNANRGYSWESNPFVWAITFKRIK